MAQNDRDFPGTLDRGSAARLRILDVWEAQDTLNSGPTEPSVTFPFMLWADTTANRLRQRNAGNSAWVDVMPLGVALDGRYAQLGVANTFTAAQVVAQSLTVDRADSVAEGGRLIVRRASDNANAYQIQAFGAGSSPVLRIVKVFGAPVQVVVVYDDGRLEVAADAVNANEVPRKGQMDAAIAASAIGIAQTWQSVIGSRAHSTSYQNTTGRPIMVSIRGSSATAAARNIEVSADNATWIVVAGLPVPETGFQTGTFIVPASWYYRVNGSATFGAWAELR